MTSTLHYFKIQPIETIKQYISPLFPSRLLPHANTDTTHNGDVYCPIESILLLMEGS